MALKQNKKNKEFQETTSFLRAHSALQHKAVYKDFENEQDDGHCYKIKPRILFVQEFLIFVNL